MIAAGRGQGGGMTSGTNDEGRWVEGDLEAGADGNEGSGAALSETGAGMGLDDSNASTFEPEEDAAAAEVPGD